MRPTKVHFYDSYADDAPRMGGWLLAYGQIGQTLHWVVKSRNKYFLTVGQRIGRLWYRDMVVKEYDTEEAATAEMKEISDTGYIDDVRYYKEGNWALLDSIMEPQLI